MRMATNMDGTKNLKTNLLINLASRTARIKYDDILRTCEEKGIAIEKVFELRRGDNLAAIITEIIETGQKTLLLAGGDGTVSDAIHLLIGTKITIGVIPLGTTNNFSKSLDMPGSVEECIARIRASRPRYVNVGKAGDRYFTNVASLGISGVIANNVRDKHKRVFGRTAYAVLGFKELFVHKPFTAKIQDVDGDIEVLVETHQLVVANGRYHAGKEIADEASVKSGEVIIFAIGGRTRLSFLIHMFNFYVGKRRSVRHTSYFMGRNVIVSTDRLQKVEIDGEIKLTTPIQISVAKNVIKVRY